MKERHVRVVQFSLSESIVRQLQSKRLVSSYLADKRRDTGVVKGLRKDVPLSVLVTGDDEARSVG